MDDYEFKEEEKITEEKEEEKETPKEEPKEHKEEHKKKSHHNSHKEHNSKKENLTERIRKNPWVVSTLVLGILSLLLIAGNFSGGVSGNIISEEAAGQKIMDFANSQVEGEVELVGVETFGDNLYQVTILFEEQQIPLYLTKDGKNLIQGVMPFDALVKDREEQTQKPSESAQNIPKSDKPLVELFIMSHCPFGTQAEKGMIPVYELLGDKIDGKIRFVNYAMHPTQGEVEEQLNQHCIQEEQSDKFLDYLRCFLKEGNGESCLDEVGIDKGKLVSCTEKVDEEYNVMSNLNDKSSWMNGRFPKFEIHDDLNIEYEVRGSPTLVINGMQVNSGRDSASYLNAICNAFNEAPEECSAALSSANPSPGFGYDTTDSEITAQCG